MPHTIGTIITDCADDNARTRQELRFASLFGVRPTFLGVGSPAPDVEAAGNLLEQLDVLTNFPVTPKDTQPIILVNVAPRGDSVKKKWDNGTPFCSFKVGNALIVSTYAGRTLSLAHDRGLVDSVELFDIPTVTAEAVKWGDLTEEQAERINHTQFRSLEFMPLVAYWIASGKPVPSTTQQLTKEDNSLGKVWCVDNFGNAKTTLRVSDIGFEEGKKVTLADGMEATCCRRLADVPKDSSAITIGSSGYGDERFLEIVVQWKDDGFHTSDSAAKRHGFMVGSQVLKA